MSAETDQPDAKVEQRLEALYRVKDDLQQIADSDVPYADDAENFLASLREAGYDA